MKKVKLTLATVASALCGLTGVANAEYVGAVTKITDHYKTVIERDAYDVEVCYNEQVTGDKTGDTLKGAIIGGIIGNNVGDVKNGGALGAVIGGMLGHSNSDASPNVITQCRNHVNYTTESRRVYSHSIITFMHNGRYYKLRFQK